MKHLLSLILLICALPAGAHEFPVLNSSDTLLVNAFDLALRTIEGNIEDGIIKAGGDYGGEWTRDASINAWNAGSLIFPEETHNSLWAVTTDEGKYIGHQYWDKIIWVLGAYNHCMVTGEAPGKVLECSANTMKTLEDTVFVAQRGLFRGPSVFNDGIAGYEEPIPDVPTTQSGVLKNRNTERIFCLSTNCIYYWAYRRLASMSRGDAPMEALKYRCKAARLRRNIRKAFYDKDSGTFNYLIDQNGDVHHFQEALGWSFAILSGVVNHKEAGRLAAEAFISDYGIPSIHPDFKRFDREHPGRHNNIVWPFVDAFWAEAALCAGDADKFVFEVKNLADLAINKGEGMFYEIYNPYTGLPDGGWQLEHQWVSCRDQTWSASGYLRMILRGVFGIGFSPKGMTVNPAPGIAETLGCTSLENIRFRGHKVSISIQDTQSGREGIYFNGHKVRKAVVPCKGEEDCEITVYR